MVHIIMHQNVYRVLVGKPEGKRPLQSFRLRWEDSVKLHLKRNGIRVCGHVGHSLVNTEMKLQVPKSLWNFLINCKNIRFLRRTLFCGVH